MKKPTEKTPTTDNRLKCSFCGKSQDQVLKLIAGPGVYVCNECVELCNEILDEQEGLFAGIRKTSFYSSGPKQHSQPHALKSVPPELIESATKSVTALIDAYEDEASRGNALPLYLVLLALQESQFGPDDQRLLPLLDNLAAIYLRGQDYSNALLALEWTHGIVEKSLPDDFDKALLLSRLAKVHIRLGHATEAEEMIDQMSRDSAV